MKTLDKIFDEDDLFERSRMIYASKRLRFVLYRTPFISILQIDVTREGFFLTLPFLFFNFFFPDTAKSIQCAIDRIRKR